MKSFPPSARRSRLLIAASAALLVVGAGEPAPQQLKAKLGTACITSADCGEGLFCSVDEGRCGQSGVCEKKPDVCAMIFAPVCGCDDKTYSNACAAKSKGVSVRQAGECAK